MDGILPGIIIGLGLGFAIGAAVCDKISDKPKITIDERLVVLETKMAILIDERNKMEKK